jgi:hypothetical protein
MPPKAASRSVHANAVDTQSGCQSARDKRYVAYTHPAVTTCLLIRPSSIAWHIGYSLHGNNPRHPFPFSTSHCAHANSGCMHRAAGNSRVAVTCCSCYQMPLLSGTTPKFALLQQAVQGSQQHCTPQHPAEFKAGNRACQTLPALRGRHAHYMLQVPCK